MTPTPGKLAPLGVSGSGSSQAKSSPRSGSPRLLSTPCDDWALCIDVAALDWTAIVPCPGCVAEVVAHGSGAVGTVGLRSVESAQVVTADALERLLSQVTPVQGNERTS